MYKFVLLTSAFIILYSTTVVSIKNKYTKEQKVVRQADLDGTDSDIAFRSRKVSLIWQKAQKQPKLQRDSSRLSELHVELKSLDEELMKFKHMQVANEDPYGDIQNSLEKKVEDVLNRYDLGSKFDQPERVPDNRIIDKSNREDELKGIVSKAKKLGFSDEELAELEKEINHHRRKMKDFDALVGELKTVEKQFLSESGNAKNSMTAEKVKELKASVKEKHEDIEQGLNRLSLMAEVPSYALDSSFTQPKIIKLWADVLRANFTEEEKESLKEELIHLERKMIKKEKLNEQMVQVKKHASLQKQQKAGGDGILKKHQDLMDKTEHLDRHVNKHTNDIKVRIMERQHNEL